MIKYVLGILCLNKIQSGNQIHTHMKTSAFKKIGYMYWKDAYSTVMGFKKNLHIVYKPP